MLKPALSICLLLLFFAQVKAQQVSVRGQVTDSSEKKSLQLASITLLRKADTSLVSFTRTDKNGKFTFPKIDTGQYVLLVSYPKFADYMESLPVYKDVDAGDVYMTQKSKLLDEVVIRTGAAIRFRGDTTEFVADSFKVKEGATVEDLMKKLPGFTVNSKGEIVAQGKRVDKVLVDGEEFFGDDPTMATQNISAKAVDKVQVFDTKSEQQQLTGITSGTEGKTVNIKLKEDAKKGAFGKAHVGTDFQDFLDAKLLYNRFVGKKKFSVFGTKTNINTGSLNWEDRQKLGIENDYEYDELGGYYFSFGNGDEFSDWNTRGLPDAYTAGTLFSNKWNADKSNLNLSYRYNRLNTVNNGTLSTQYILPSGITYTNRYTYKNGLNQQHVFTGKYEWKLDSLASIKIVSNNTFKSSQTFGRDRGESFNEGLDTLNTSSKVYSGTTNRNQTDNQLTYKQMFKKKNRLWQTVFRYGIIDDDNSSVNNTLIRYFQNGTFQRDSLVDQKKIFDGRSTTYGVKTTFSEPLSLAWTLVADYAYNKNHSISKNNTFDKDNDGKYGLFNPTFSNNFILDAFSHSGNATLRYVGKKVRMALGSGVSTVKLGLKNLDSNTVKKFNFLNITPQASFNYSPKQQKNFSLNYRGTTRQPTINQLQPLRDNTDPLNEYIGNPNLKVGFNHSISANFNEYKVLKQRYAWAYASINFQQNAIAQYTTFNTVTGKRTYSPVNVNGNRYWYMGGNWNKSPSKKKPGYGGDVNGNGANNINFVNGIKATTKSFSSTLRLYISMENEEKYNFTVGPTIGYNTTKSSLPSSFNNNYYTYGGRADGFIKFAKKFEFSTDVNADLRQKIQAFSSNTNIIQWNARLTRKLFKKDAGNISLIANDILNENKGFTRTINSTQISDDRYQRISRYFLLRFEWSFTKAPGGAKP